SEGASERDRRARAQGGRDPRARRARGRQASARGADGADPARHRGRDAARDRRAQARGRRFDRDGHREGHPQGAERGRSAPARGGGALGARFRSAERGRRAALMEEIAQVYARSLFEVADEHGVLDEVHGQLEQFADALDENRDLAVFFFSPYFSTAEKRDALHRAVDGAEETFMNFLEALLERHRMPAIFRIRAQFDTLW